MNKKNRAIYIYAEYAIEIDNKFYITVDYIVKAIKHNYLNMPIYTPDDKLSAEMQNREKNEDSKIKDLTTLLNDITPYEDLHEQEVKVYDIEDVYDVVENNLDTINLWDYGIKNYTSIIEIISANFKLIDRMNFLNQKILLKGSKLEGDLFKLIHAVNFLTPRTNKVRTKRINKEIDDFNLIKKKYKKILLDLNNFKMSTPISTIFQELSEIEIEDDRKYIHINEIFDCIYKFLKQKYDISNLFMSSDIKGKSTIKSKKDYLREKLKKSGIRRKKIKGIIHFNLKEVIEVLSNPKFRFTINGWVFKDENHNFGNEVEYFLERANNQRSGILFYIEETLELISAIIDIERNTINQIYETIKYEFSNPFDKNKYIKDFDQQIQNKVEETNNYLSIYSEINEDIFELYDNLNSERFNEKNTSTL